MTIQHRILELLEQKGSTQKELANATKIPYSTLNSWLGKDRDIPAQYVIDICVFLQCSLEYLLCGDVSSFYTKLLEGLDAETSELITIYNKLDSQGKIVLRAAAYNTMNRFKNTNFVIEKGNVSLIPLLKEIEPELSMRGLCLYDLPASAGTGVFLDSDHYEIVSYPASMIPLDTTFGVRISGDSMIPMIRDGDIALIKRQPMVEDGEIGVFVVNGDSYCKQYSLHGKRPFLLSLNEAYPPIPVTQNDEVRVIGKVLDVLHP